MIVLDSKCIFGTLIAVCLLIQGSCNLVQRNSLIEKASSETLAKTTISQFTLNLSLGLVTDYGATPWRTSDIKFGDSPMNLALDTGTNLLWATMGDCNTVACKVHRRIDPSQANFKYVSNPSYPKTVDFGAWGNMVVKLGSIPLFIGTEYTTQEPVQFDASIDYSGSQFEYLSWGGGIGFPSDTSFDDENVETLIKHLFDSGSLASPEFSIVTDRESKSGKFMIGYIDPDVKSDYYGRLTPKLVGGSEVDYLWGTSLHYVKLGTNKLSDLSDTVFFVDSGSSRFKAEAKSIRPILDALLTYKDSNGTPIFETYKDESSNQPFTGVKYSNGKGPSDFSNILPDFSFAISNDCDGGNSIAVFSLSPEQYSYQVQAGGRQGEWVAAFHILDGIPGLLVGSTFMDLVVTQFTYEVSGTDLTQGDMVLYKKAKGEVPANVECRPMSASSSHQ